jgi:hypothetical protein
MIKILLVIMILFLFSAIRLIKRNKNREREIREKAKKKYSSFSSMSSPLSPLSPLSPTSPPKPVDKEKQIQWIYEEFFKNQRTIVLTLIDQLESYYDWLKGMIQNPSTYNDQYNEVNTTTAIKNNRIRYQSINVMLNENLFNKEYLLNYVPISSKIVANNETRQRTIGLILKPYTDLVINTNEKLKLIIATMSIEERNKMIENPEIKRMMTRYSTNVYEVQTILKEIIVNSNLYDKKYNDYLVWRGQIAIAEYAKEKGILYVENNGAVQSIDSYISFNNQQLAKQTRIFRINNKEVDDLLDII